MTVKARNSIALCVLVLLAGCTVASTPYDYETARANCEANGGLEQFRVRTGFFDENKTDTLITKCRNGAEFRQEVPA